LAKDIKDLRNRKNKKDSSAEINTFFNKIYACDAFAIPYAQFSNSSFTYGLDQ
jgi:predicted transcriptional regulator